MSSARIHAKIRVLEQDMLAAADAMEFELAAKLRNEIAHLRGEPVALGDGEAPPLVGQPPPGSMGLGTNMPVKTPPKNWQKPKKPDPLTRNHRPGGRRSGR